jgi:hypothetical protein
MPFDAAAKAKKGAVEGGSFASKHIEFSGEDRQELTRRGEDMSFGLYSLGFAIVIAGLIYAAHLMHIPPHWIAVGAFILVGLGILKGVQATRQKDPAS